MLISITTVISVRLGRNEDGKTAGWLHWILPGTLSKASQERGLKICCVWLTCSSPSCHPADTL